MWRTDSGAIVARPKLVSTWFSAAVRSGAGVGKRAVEIEGDDGEGEALHDAAGCGPADMELASFPWQAATMPATPFAAVILAAGKGTPDEV